MKKMFNSFIWLTAIGYYALVLYFLMVSAAWLKAIAEKL